MRFWHLPINSGNGGDTFGGAVPRTARDALVPLPQAKAGASARDEGARAE